MNHKRINILLGLLVTTVAFALTAHRLPELFNSRPVTAETRTFDETVLRDAMAGNTRSQYLLGLQYTSGLGMKQDAREALNWFGKAAAHGLAKAQLELANGLESSAFQTESDLRERLNAKINAKMFADLDSLRHDAEARHDSTGVQLAAEAAQKREEALKWFRKAAEQGLVDAQLQLARSLMDAFRRDGTNRDENVALESESWKWCRKAAEQGHGDAQYRLAFHYEESKNYVEAARWYKMDADQGSLSAMSHLAEMYYYGRGVPQDRAEAVKLALEVADGADPRLDDNLFFRLGEWYESDVGTLHNDVEAYKWFNIVAAQGGPYSAQTATKRRDRLATRMSPAQIAEGQSESTAYLLVRKSSNQGADQRQKTDPTDGAKATGSGFFVTDDGHLFTSYHVVKNANRIVLQTRNGRFPARLLKSDMANDLVLLKVEGQFRALPIASSGPAQLGEAAFTIGFPNTAIQGIEPKLTRGEISSLSGIQDDPRHFQISVPVQPGNSGGPLINLRGDVVGIVRLRLDDEKTFEITHALPQNVNYAVKSSFMMTFLESVPGLSAKLHGPHSGKQPRFEDVVKEAQDAVALVLVY